MTIGTKLAGAALAIALLAGAVFWYTRSHPQVKPVTFTARGGDLTITITELGELRAMESVTILAQRDGPIAYLIPEGTIVARGDVLVRFDPGQHEVALRTSQVELRVAEAELRRTERDMEAQRQRLFGERARLEGELRLAEVELADLKRKPLPEEVEKARLEVDKAKLAFDNAEKKLKVLPELVEKGFITRSTLEEAELGYLAAKAALQAARFNLEKVSAGATPEEIERATIRLRQAKSALERADAAIGPQLAALNAAVERETASVAKARNLIEKAQAELAKTVLRAPQAGLVVYAKGTESTSPEKIHLGMMAFAGQALIHLPDITTIVVDVEVIEVDIRKVRVGAPAEVKLEAYPGVLFHGRVVEISTLARLKRNRLVPDPKLKVFDVAVQIEGRDPRLKPGSTATVDIIVDRLGDVIVVPLSAVVSRGREPVVFVLTGRRTEERKVVLGPSNDQFVVVEEGLSVGEQVILGLPEPQ